ncbi:MAG: hypothetical protein AAGC49_01105 [Brevundimonas sp.]
MRNAGRRTAVVAALAMALLAGCTDGDASPASAAAAGPGRVVTPAAWSELPAGGPSPRIEPLVAWLGDAFVVVGGMDGAPCPANASCISPPPDARHRDGAAYDPRTRRWTAIADAPTVLRDSDSAAVVDGVLYVQAVPVDSTAVTLLAYDPAKDEWTQRSPGPCSGRLTAYHHVVLCASGTDERGVTPDAVYDPATDSWSELPDDPLDPSFDRTLSVVGDHIIVTANDLSSVSGSTPPVVHLAELDPSLTTWTLLPDSEVVGSATPIATDDGLVFPETGTSDGGEVNGWGRAYPNGGIYDVEKRTWAPLPGPSVAGSTPAPLVAAGDRAVTGVAVIDVGAGTSVDLPDVPWGEDDQPSFAASPTSVLAWGGAADETALGYLLDLEPSQS